MGAHETNRLREAELARVALVVRGLLAEPSGDADVPYKRVILECRRAEAAPEVGVAGLPPLRLEGLEFDAAGEKLREDAARAVDAYARRHHARPEVVSAPGLGVLRVVEPPAGAPPPLRNEVALVTGAAGAIGSGICRGLLENGCRVAATDLPGDRLDDFVDGFRETAGERIIGVPLDVTEGDSVAAAFDAVAREWGGVDIVIANAGIPLIGAITEMSVDEFRHLERVNVEGTLLTLSEAGRRMQLQGTGGDIVLVSTKNVFSPGARFGAYSATKAGAHQLARIASLELAEFDIRVNMVAPDAVFADGERKSGLWEKIGPDRMRHKGIDEKGLREHYRRRNLLKATITARHVANAVLFFVTRQTPTTGATIPVDGGLPDATPR